MRKNNETLSPEVKKRLKKKAMLRRIRKKSAIAFSVVFVALLVLVVRIGMINYTKGNEYSKIVLNHQSYTSRTIASRRGDILDRNGTVLAYSERVYNLILDPKVVLSDSDFKDPTLNALTTYFDLKRSDLEEILSTRSDSSYVRLLTQLSKDEIAGMKSVLADTKNNPNVKGVWFEDSYLRQYPFGTFAADTIGFASAANGGEIGLEKQYNNELTGTDGVSYNYIDENLDSETTTQAAVDGKNIVTTIDYGLQSIIERKIEEYNAKLPSKNTAVLAMDPNTGEILAMASYPQFDLNNPRDLSREYTEEQLNAMTDEEKVTAMYEVWKNYAVSQVYEPGSTFKSITVASALEENLVNDNSTFFCAGSTSIGGYTIRCWDRDGHGELKLGSALGQSCNMALVNIGQLLGADKMRKHQNDFGFGSKTGIDLPGEERGLVKDALKMDITDIATNSFGQNISVNMVQMAAAYSSLINGGYYYKPHMVRAIQNANGSIAQTIEPTLVRQTVTKETSDKLREYLYNAVEHEAVNAIQLPGYAIGGKTGTAQKIPRSEMKWVVSCFSFAPVDNPEVLFYVVIDEPDKTEGTTATSIDAQDLLVEIMKEAFPYLGIYKDPELIKQYEEQWGVQILDTEDEKKATEKQTVTETSVEAPDSDTEDVTNAENEAE